MVVLFIARKSYQTRGDQFVNIKADRPLLEYKSGRREGRGGGGRVPYTPSDNIS